ncbi:MAG TPA: L-aspartate oxidase, partial [Coxiellaceae bacterium]|nr:L-aspartate oxidase [Coxiellaceae bacterium]
MHAQGGIAAAIANDDSIESHIEDTLISGDGLCDPDVVRFVITNAKDAIHWLVNQGVNFSKID